MAVVVGLLAAGCGVVGNPGEVAVETISMQKLYPQAMQLGQAWKVDAQFVGAETPFWISGTGGAETCAFYFISPTTSGTRLVVEYNTRTQLFSDRYQAISRADAASQRPIDDGDWPVNSVDALKTAESQGGAQFLVGRPANHLSLGMRLAKVPRGDQFPTLWVLDYEDLESGQYLQIAVDARSGAVVETAGS
jgi:hypothetical protein